MILENKTYDFLKMLCLRILPALTTLVIALGKIWGWESAPLIGATIAAVNAFIGACLGVSSDNYYKDTPTKRQD